MFILMILLVELRRTEMKLAFIVTEVPPSLYYSGEGKCQSVVVPVEIPDELFPQEITTLAKADLQKETKVITDIMIVKD